MSEDTKDAAKTDDRPESKGSPAASAPESSAKLIITLLAVAVVAGAALAGANNLTKDRIKAARAQVKLAGIQRVLPKCENDAVKSALKVKGPKGEPTMVYRCMKTVDGKLQVVAVAIERNSSANTHKPYGGLIQVLVGIDAKTGRVRSFKTKGKPDVGVVILKHNETPGLGSKSETYAFRKAFANRNLVGKNQTSDPKHPGQKKVWAVKKDNPAAGFVDAISGATITSRAVTEIVMEALMVFNMNKKAIVDTSAGTKPAKGAKPGKE